MESEERRIKCVERKTKSGGMPLFFSRHWINWELATFDFSHLVTGGGRGAWALIVAYPFFPAISPNLRNGGTKMNENLTYVKLPERLLKALDVAETLNISRAMAYRLMHTREIQTVRIGTARRVRPMDLQSYINENLTPANS